MAKTVIKIKVGYERQADKPIYLLADGSIECGRFRYEGRYKKRFKEFYNRIYSLAYKKSKNGVIDVSNAKYWDAAQIRERNQTEAVCR